MRLFIAINLPLDTKAYLQKVIQELKIQSADKPIKWVNPRNLHLTLGFIKDLQPEKLEILKQTMESHLDFKQFKLKLEKLEVFTAQYYPKVIKISLTDEQEQLQPIKNAVNEIFKKLDLPIDQRRFSAHITLGRIKKPIKKLELNIKIKPLKFTVKTIDLMLSTLTPEGPIYKTLMKVKIKKQEKQLAEN